MSGAAAVKIAAMKKTLLIVALLGACCVAQAQSTPAKKELIARILKVQQPGIETLARSLAEEPAVGLMERAEQVLPQRVARERQEAVAKEIQGDVKKYLDEAVPLVRDRAVKLAPASVGALLEQKFSEAELKQVATFLESPVYVKYQQLGPDMQKVLVEKVIADARGAIEPKVRELEASIARRLGVNGAASPASAPPKR